MAYDVEGARKAGLSDAEINNYLANKYKYNLAGAREAGLADTDILTHLITKDKPVAKAVAPTVATTEVTPISSPEEVTSQMETPRGAFAAQPGAGLTEQQKKQLADATAKYEAEVPFLQRQTDPIKAGVKGLATVVPNLEITSLQKEINAIREGKVGPRDPLTGEMTPLQPEEAEAAIKSLQARQAEAQKKVMGVQTEISKIKKRPAVELLNDVTTARQAFQAFQADPLGVMASVSLESLPQVAPALVLGAITRNPTVGALAMGSTSFASELSSGVMEYFQDNGINTGDPIAVNKALNDPTLFAKAYEHALARGSIIAIADTAAAGLASKMLVPKGVIKNQFAKEAVNIGVAQPVAQMVSGAGGEILAQLATEGEVKKPGRAVLEAAGEGPSSLLETGAFGGQQAYERLPSTIAKREAEAKSVEDQKKILDKLNAPGAMDALGQQFNDEVERLKNTINPKTQKKGSAGRLYTEEEAFALAGDAILQEGGLDGLESIIGGANKPGVSVPSGTSGTDTGTTDTTQGNLAATGTTTTATGSGEGTELNTLVAELKAKYPQMTDEQVTALATESLRQKQMAADTGAPAALTEENKPNVLDTGFVWRKDGVDIPIQVVAERLASDSGEREVVALVDGEEVNIPISQIARSPDFKSTTPPVKIGKPRGRPKADKTPEQIAAAAEYRKQRQDIGKNAITEVTKAEKVLNRVVDEQAIIENSGTEKEAQDTLFGLREERIGALAVAHGLATNPDQKNKTAGKRATTLLEKADPQERELGKQRHEAKQKLGTPSRSEIIESTNGQDNAAFEKFSFAKGAVNYIANSKSSNAFEKVLAKRLAPFLNGVKFVIVDSEADMPTPKLQRFMKDSAGLFDPETNTIYVLRKGGINNTVVLHEALHAATVARIIAFDFLKNAKRPIPAALRVPVQELYDTMEDAKKIYDELADAGMLPPQMLKIPKEAFTDLREFVAYGLSLPLMQDFLLLAPGEYAGEAPGFISKIFTRFVQSLRKMFSMGKEHMSALQDLIIVTDKLLSTPVTPEEIELNELLGEPSAAKAPKSPKAPKPPKAPKQLKTVENVLRKLRLSHSSTDMNTSIGQLMMQTRNASDAIRLMKAVYSTISVAKLKFVMRAFDTGDITRIAGDKLTNLKVINAAVNDMAGMRTRMIRELSEKVPAWINFNQKYKKGGKALADVINAATLLQVDPAKYPDAATAIKNDPKLKQIENDILNPSTDPKSLPRLKGERSKRTEAIKLLYGGGILNNPITGEKFTMLGWDALGKFGNGEGHAIYKMARDSYKQTFDLHEKLLKEKIASSNVPGDINDASTPKGKLIAAITKTFQEARLLDIYFPLMRYGNFFYSVGKGASGEFYMFESATARNAAVEARVAELNKARGTNRSLAKMIEDGDIDVGDDIRKLREKHVESSDMLKEIFAMLDSNKMSDIEAVKDNIYQMYLMTLPDKDIRRKFVHRQGKTGFSADVIRNFITSQHTAANQLARLSYADKIRNGIAAAYAEIAQNPDKLKLSVLIREISARALDEITPSVPDDGIDWNQVAAAGNKFVFYWLLTSPKSALIQMTQLPIVGLPTLGAEFGVAKAGATALRYSALWNKFSTTKTDDNGNVTTNWGQPSIGDSKYVTEHKDPAYRKTLKDAWNFANDKDIFMSTYAGDMTAMSAVPTGQYHNVVSKATRGVFNFMGGAFHHAERISREIMFMSSFELAYADYKQKGMDDKAAFDAATEKALSLTYDALFNYTQYNKPRLMKGSPGAKLATQFLTYPLQMTSYLVRNFYGMLPFLNKEEKKEAAIKFFGTLGMTGLFAGVTGFPLYSFIMGVAEGVRELMRDEDDEDYDEDDEGNPLGKRNLDLWFRNWFIPTYFGPDSNLASVLGLTEEDAATLARSVEMGPLSAVTGLNLGASTSLDGLWFRDDTPGNTSKEAFQNFVFGFTGPIGSIGVNIAGAFDDFNNGQINRGFEKLSPAWLRGSLTSYRLSKEGATTTKGDEIMDAEFYTTGKLAAQALGFGNTEVAQIQKSNFMAKQIVTKIEKEKATLLNRLDIAVRNDDDDKVDSILEQVDKFNTKNSMLPISGETINNSLQSREERRGKSSQGLSVTDAQAPFVYPLVEGTRSVDKR